MHDFTYEVFRNSFKIYKDGELFANKQVTFVNTPKLEEVELMAKNYIDRVLINNEMPQQYNTIDTGAFLKYLSVASRVDKVSKRIDDVNGGTLANGFRIGEGEPTYVGEQNEVYFDKNSQELYQYMDGNWISQGVLGGGPQGNQGPQGEQGPAGPQGPIGPVGPQGLQGARGEKGEGINIGMTYESVVAMNADIDNIPDNTLIFIVSGSGQPNNGELYSKTNGQLILSGELEGIQGPEGPPGPQGQQGIQGPQGPRGLQGIQGIAGPQGIRGIKGDKGDPGENAPRNFLNAHDLNDQVLGSLDLNLNFTQTVPTSTIPYSNGVFQLEAGKNYLIVCTGEFTPSVANRYIDLVLRKAGSSTEYGPIATIYAQNTGNTNLNYIYVLNCTETAGYRIAVRFRNSTDSVFTGRKSRGSLFIQEL